VAEAMVFVALGAIIGQTIAFAPRRLASRFRRNYCCAQTRWFA